MKKKKETKKRRSPYVAPVCAVLSLILIAVLLYGMNILIKKREERRRTEMVRTFWENEVNPLWQQVSKSTYHIACINERFKTLGEAIVKKYGNPINLIGMSDYHYKGPGVIAMCRVENGRPVARMSARSIMDAYQLLQRTGRTNWHDEFEILVTVSLLHELEHIAEVKTYENSFNGIVEGEAQAWANTCTYALVPLSEQNLPIQHLMRQYLDAWKVSGSSNNIAWANYIRRRYSTFNE